VSTIALAGLLAGILLLIVAALVWQEAKRRPQAEGPVYVVEDAVRFIVSRLDPDTAVRLRTSDVRRIVEWEVYYLQGLAQPRRHTPVETVAGGWEEAVTFIAGRIEEAHGVAYAVDDIRRVLRLEAAYLQSIGAVGDPAGGDGS
jgi:hypothetical protein